MKRGMMRGWVFTIVVLVMPAGIVSAVPSWVSIDVSGLSGTDLQLEIALYDNSGVIGDSWALIDNVVLGTILDDFEDGTIGGFDSSLNPSSVWAAPGSLVGGGNYVLRIDEDASVTPTITFRDYTGWVATTLSFDFEMNASSTAGPFGLLDELVFSILDPVTLYPLLPSLTTGYGDVLAVNAAGMKHTGDVSVTVIPAPPALLLVCIGFAGVGLWKRLCKAA